MSKISIPPKKIVAYIKKKFEYRERRQGEEFIICNPLNGDTGYHFNINPEKGVCHDWRDDSWAGKPNPKTGKRSCNIIRFVSLYEKCSTAEAIKILLDGAEAEYTENKKEFVEYELTLPENKKLVDYQNEELAQMLIKWLGRRSYTVDDIDKNDLRFLGTEVIWPYYEFETVVYWQSRSYLNKRFSFPNPNITNSKGETIGKVAASKGQFLYGFDDIEMNGYIIITEAIFDKHTLGEQTLASGGAALTPDQLIKIRILNPKKGIILAPDSDAAGIKSIIQNYHLLASLNFPIFYSIPPASEADKTDWNELYEKHGHTKSQIRNIFEKNIKKISITEIIKLSELISSKKRIRS
jgi:hypothetical protein